MKLWALPVVAVLVTATPALAYDPTTLHLTDRAGDANSINDGGEFSSGNTATPHSQPDLDMREVTLSPLRAGERTTGLTVTFHMEAPIQDRLQIGLKTGTVGCPDVLLRYARAAGTRGVLTTGCSSGSTTVPAVVRGRTLTFTIPFSALPDEARRDNELNRINAFTQIHLASAPPLRPIGSTMIDTTLGKAKYRLAS